MAGKKRTDRAKLVSENIARLAVETPNINLGLKKLSSSRRLKGEKELENLRRLAAERLAELQAAKLDGSMGGRPKGANKYAERVGEIVRSLLDANPELLLTKEDQWEWLAGDTPNYSELASGEEFCYDAEGNKLYFTIPDTDLATCPPMAKSTFLRRYLYRERKKN